MLQSVAASTLGPRSILGWLQGGDPFDPAFSLETPVLAVRDLPTRTVLDRESHVQVEVPHPFDRRTTVWITARQDEVVPHVGSVAVWSPAPNTLVM